MISRAQYAASTMNYYASAARIGRTHRPHASAEMRRPRDGGRIAAADSVPALYS